MSKRRNIQFVQNNIKINITKKFYIFIYSTGCLCPYRSHIFGRRLRIGLSLLPLLHSSVIPFIRLRCTHFNPCFFCTILLLLLMCLLKNSGIKHIFPMFLFQSQSMGPKLIEPPVCNEPPLLEALFSFAFSPLYFHSSVFHFANS